MNCRSLIPLCVKSMLISKPIHCRASISQWLPKHPLLSQTIASPTLTAWVAADGTFLLFQPILILHTSCKQLHQLTVYPETHTTHISHNHFSDFPERHKLLISQHQSVLNTCRHYCWCLLPHFGCYIFTSHVPDRLLWLAVCVCVWIHVCIQVCMTSSTLTWLFQLILKLLFEDCIMCDC